MICGISGAEFLGFATVVLGSLTIKLVYNYVYLNLHTKTCQ
jgi:hypothetical protein